MPKANRICHCCGQPYYYCPSCADEKRPTWYIMWDSEKCKNIFNTLTDESTKKITTKECKEKLIELGVDKFETLKDSVKNHIDKVMSCEDSVKNNVESNNIEAKVETETIAEELILKTVQTEPVETKVEDTKVTENKTVIEATSQVKTKRINSLKNKNKKNSEVD